MADEIRRMHCPYCGYVCDSSRAEAIYCGPHMPGDDSPLGPGACKKVSPAVRMIELTEAEFAALPEGRGSDG